MACTAAELVPLFGPQTERPAQLAFPDIARHTWTSGRPVMILKAFHSRAHQMRHGVTALYAEEAAWLGGCERPLIRRCHSKHRPVAQGDARIGRRAHYEY